MPTPFRLRFPLQQIGRWASRYSYPGEADLIAGPVRRGRERGFLTKPEFLQIAYWKTPRSKRRCATNDSAFVEEVTRIALAGSTSARLRIECLRLLDGVGWPTASVILHLCHVEPYPILDFRALWSLSSKVPTQYDFDFWDAYTNFCRTLGAKAGCDLRTLDRALWQYSKERQNGA